MIPARFAEGSDEALREGTDRGQSTLFPECLEDWIGEDNAVRVIDVTRIVAALGRWRYLVRTFLPVRQR